MAVRTGSIPHTTSELLLESLYAGVLGGSAVALFFLFLDLLEGQPFFTPSLMGSVIFHDVPADAVTKVQVEAVVLFSIAHIAAFAALGALISLLVHEVELHTRHPVLVMLVLFAILEAGFFVLAPLAMSGVIERLGIVRVGAANLLAATTMALFYALAHRARAWKKISHTTGELVRDSLYSGVLGGSAVALFFLVLDPHERAALHDADADGQRALQGCRRRCGHDATARRRHLLQHLPHRGVRGSGHRDLVAGPRGRTPRQAPLRSPDRALRHPRSGLLRSWPRWCFPA